MEIKAVKFREKGFMTRPFALGGEDGVDKFDPNVKYRSCLQNYLIDTGDEIILVDTGFPAEYPGMVVDETTQIYIGSKITDYMTALKNLGYKPEQVTKILVTHKHEDHTGELRSFPNAKIYIGPEDADALNLQGENIVRATYPDGPYHTFDASQKIAEGVYFLPAKGHTKGNSIIVAECDGLFYMMHGDVTYTDEALYENKLSVAFEDKEAARDTLNRVREFIRKNPTVYCSTHTPTWGSCPPLSLTLVPHTQSSSVWGERMDGWTDGRVPQSRHPKRGTRGLPGLATSTLSPRPRWGWGSVHKALHPEGRPLAAACWAGS